MIFVKLEFDSSIYHDFIPAGIVNRNANRNLTNWYKNSQISLVLEPSRIVNETDLLLALGQQIILENIMKPLLICLAMWAGFVSVPAIAATVEARIDLSDQKMKVYRNGNLYYTWKVSTARRGYVTPTGNYRPTRMHKMWYSRKYDMSPMPYSIFYHRGYAVHGTNAIKNLGRPASHGCVRLHPDNARTLYNMVKSVGASNAKIKVRR
jgi:hypothetical protein